MTDTAVEVFYGHERVASHARLRGRPGQYSSVKAHMPEGHREYLEWDGDRFRRWASGIGEKTAAVIDALLRAGSAEQQSYRACMGVLKLGKRHGEAMLEWASRKSHAFERFVKKAELEQNDAGVATIDYHSGRKLNKALIQKLASCEYISQYRNIFITGATGSGKTYLACAFGMEACKRFYSVRFTRLPDLLMDLSAAEDRHALENALQKYTKPTLLIIDEWLLFKLRENEARLLLEVIHKRRKKSSTIFCSQYEEKDWYNQICDGESTLADAIMDRISFDSYKINIEYIDKSVDKSMREVYGLNPSEAQ